MYARRLISIFIILFLSLLAFYFATEAVASTKNVGSNLNWGGPSISFQERVNYQREIEEVYWKHRVWPKENPETKPPLHKMLSDSAIITRVEDYLRKSNALDQFWSKPITAKEMQAEMDRMVRNTKRPQLLRELFTALNNDPHVIAECLVRPVLADRLIHSSYANDDRFHGENTRFDSWWHEEKKRIPVEITEAFVTYNLQPLPASTSCVNDSWVATSELDVPDAREIHTAVWTGTEMIIWGGFVSGIPGSSGGRYDPTTDSWTATSITDVPEGRAYHTAVWTGTEMIIWGGTGDNIILSSGGRYNPYTDAWTATSNSDVPDERYLHTAVWSGTEMIVWGGRNLGGNLSSGGRYNPSTDSWVATNTTNVPDGRLGHTAIWTGQEMIIWGGGDGSSVWSSGGNYNPSTDSWTATSTANVPEERGGHTTVWTGNEMIVWGGYNYKNGFGLLSTGGQYDPLTDSWTATTNTNVPAGRSGHTAVFTAAEMIIWGSSSFDTSSSGGRYNPSTDSWIPTSIANVPEGRFFHTAVWTGSEMIVWGGEDLINNDYLQTGGLYCATPPAGLLTLTISDVSLPEGKNGKTKFEFVVTLSSPATSKVNVDYATADGNATESDGDYSSKSGSVRIRRGETTAIIKIKVKGDKLLEGDEIFTVNLSNATGATVLDPQAVGTILNDD